MKVLKVKQIQAWDRYTIQNEPIASIDLMERASGVFVSWLTDKLPLSTENIGILVSKGNNGGDGLVAARLLSDRGYHVTVYILPIQPTASPDFSINLERLRYKQIIVEEIHQKDPILAFEQYDLLIDGVFGSGLTRPVEGYWAQVFESVNKSQAPVYAIDIPSGMFADEDTPVGAAVIQANDCLSFEAAKPAFFLTSNSKHLKQWSVRSIGLLHDFPVYMDSKSFLIDESMIAGKLRKRGRFDHKGTFGRALIVAGQKGMAGASVLSTRAACRSGAGLVYTLSPDINYSILQQTVPEALVIHGYGNDHLSQLPELSIYDAIGIGPGIGKHAKTIHFLEELLQSAIKPLVLDADALNILSENTALLKDIPAHSIITPHPGEFKRLFGTYPTETAKLEALTDLAKRLNLIIVLKGGHTIIATPGGALYYNNSGNPGMATGGSGDVLTGLITGLLAQGYAPTDAAIVGVYLHGLAGDLCADSLGQEAMIASDIIDHIPAAFKKINLDTKNSFK